MTLPLGKIVFFKAFHRLHLELHIHSVQHTVQKEVVLVSKTYQGSTEGTFQTINHQNLVSQHD